MKTWWIGAALAAMCVGQVAWGQYPPAGGSLLPEPDPVAACPPQGPPVTPGPLTGAVAPPGPGDALSLPAGIPTAWGKGPVPESGFYFHAGGMGLQRYRPGRTAIVLRDTTALVNSVFVPVVRQTTVAQDTHQIDPSFDWGGRATIGYLDDDAGLELTGFYLPEQDASSTVRDPGRLVLFFQNAPPAFTARHSVWLHADSNTTSLQSSLGNVELNYRWWSRALTGFEGILGLRYMELQERARLTTADDLSVTDINGLPNPAQQASYMTRVHNHMLMPQTGFEWNLPIVSWLSFGIMGKAAWGANYVDVTTRLTRGDGFVGAEGRRANWSYTSVYEVNAFFDLVTLERMRIRAGYSALWAVHVDEALQQVHYDLSSQPGPRRDGGSIFYHGPMIEVQFLF